MTRISFLLNIEMKNNRKEMKTYGNQNKVSLILSTIVATSALLLSCVDAKDPYSEEFDPKRMGTIEVASLDREGDFILAQSSTPDQGGVAKAQAPDVETFRVAILDTKTGEVVTNKLTGEKYQWDNYSQVSGQLVAIPSGKYKLEAASLETDPLAAWEMPYYYGIKDFTVKISELTRLDVICKLANAKVTVDYDQDFLAKVTDPMVKVYMDYSNPATAEKQFADLVYPVGETRAGYFQVPGDGILYVKVTGIRKVDGKPLGEGEGQTFKITGVAATQWHKIQIKYEQTGQLSANIKMDYTTIDSEHQVEIPDGEGVIDGGSNNENWEEEPGDQPGGGLDIVGADFNGSPFNLSEQLTVSVANKNIINVRFDAPKGIEQLYVTIESDDLAPLLPVLGLAVGEAFDIANPPAGPDAPAWVEMFANEEIGILDPAVPIKGKKIHTFSVGGLMGLLGSVADLAHPKVHKFHLKMVDAAGKVKEATLAVYLTE